MLCFWEFDWSSNFKFIILHNLKGLNYFGDYLNFQKLGHHFETQTLLHI